MVAYLSYLLSIFCKAHQIFWRAADQLLLPRYLTTRLLLLKSQRHCSLLTALVPRNSPVFWMNRQRSLNLNGWVGSGFLLHQEIASPSTKPQIYPTFTASFPLNSLLFLCSHWVSVLLYFTFKDMGNSPPSTMEWMGQRPNPSSERKSLKADCILIIYL